MRLTLLFLVFSLSVNAQSDCDSVPTFNLEVLKLAQSKMGKKVDRGECWDLIAFALNESDAEWDGYMDFGREINRKQECLQPGDIIQFEKVKRTYRIENTTYSETMYHHTAIVAEVISTNELVLLHQNTEDTGRKVGESTFTFDSVTGGKMKFYRPVGQ